MSTIETNVTRLPIPAVNPPDDQAIPKPFIVALENAELLVTYAAETGVVIAGDVRGKVLAARRAVAGGWSDQNAQDVLDALTVLSAKLKPVSGESLRVCEVDKLATKTIRWFRVSAIVLVAIIIPFSIAAFVGLATCESIHKGIELANGLAVTLARLPPPDTTVALPTETGGNVRQHSESDLKELQQFAATIRDIDQKAMKLRWFTLNHAGDLPAPLRSHPTVFQLPPPKDLNVEREVTDKIELYQKVRAFAQNVQETVQVTFGAATSCVLPMLYALLGACAFLIRSFADQRRKRIFTSHSLRPARILIAAIGGLVVGLFGNFGEGHTAGLSPLAVAFMVGYGTDVFFFFIDGLLRMFARPNREPAPQRSL